MERPLPHLHTPQQVQRWLLTLRYNTKDTMRTLLGVRKFREAHCLEAALSAAAILEPHGYPPLILDLDSAGELAHTLFLFTQRGQFGAIGWSRDVGLNGRKPVFKTLKALVRSYATPYIDEHERITSYGVLDLRTLKRQDWRDSQHDVWYVEQALTAMPHTRLTYPRGFVQTWKRRYIRFKRQYPRQQPDYFPGQHAWM